ncbi:MAG: hypothetical protein Q8R98_03410 [Rubrivivax sp.]|nr:hypothetical protein [Rubrivivax sp.]MDP3223732.1 hypothetical protein [Rubrivivax sp.]MDP3610875.1 hypothetical protein [Rubrivivax sp.]
MNFKSTGGGLLPLWTLGAPLLIGVFLLLKARKSTLRSGHDRSDLRDRYATPPSGMAPPPIVTAPTR